MTQSAGVNPFKHLVSVTLVLLISGLCAFSFTSTARALKISNPIKITSFQVNGSNQNASTPQVPTSITMGGTFLSTTERQNVELVLSIYGPIRTRSELSNNLAHPNQYRGILHSDAYVRLPKVLALTETSWSLTFDVKKYLGNVSNGVYSFGVVERGTNIQTSITEPWFYESVKIQPTQVAILTQITTINDHLANGASQSLQKDAKNLNRLNAFVDSGIQTDWAIDESTVQWLNDLKTTALGTQASSLLAQIQKLRVRSHPLIYNHANLQALLKQNPSDISAVLQSSGASSQNPAYYFAQDGSIDSQSLSSLTQLGNVLPLVTNEYLYGNKDETASANKVINNSQVLVIDQGASNCFLNNTIFETVTCLKSTIAMITAQAPNNSRTILIAPPALWTSKKNELQQVVTALNNNTWGQITSLQKVLTSEPSKSFKQTYSTDFSNFPAMLSKQGNRLVQKAYVLGNAFNNSTFTNNFTNAKLRSYSDFFRGRSALSFITKNHALLERYRNLITIQSSSKVTITNARTEIPITVVNNTSYSLTTQVKLNSSAKSRFQSQTSEFVTVASNQRVTVPMKIELTGTGSVQVEARLQNLDQQDLGISKSMEITSSAYQAVARTLVWGAFGLLVALAIINQFRKRRDPSLGEDETIKGENDTDAESVS